MPAFVAHSRSDESVGADVLVVPVASVAGLPERLAGVGRGVAAAAARAVDLGDFEAKPGARLHLYSHGVERFPRVLLIAVAEGASPAGLRAEFARLARDPLFDRVDTVAVDAGPELGQGVEFVAGVAAAVDGLLHGTYRWTRSTKARPASAARFVFLARGARDLARVKQGIERGRNLGESVIACRELANTPANIMGPEELADAAATIGREAGLKVRVLSGNQLVRERMEGILQVGGGSARAPRVAVLEYDGGGGDWIALVGKGLVYDTGGLSIKPNASMVEMKFDKCGACAVIGAIRAAAKLGVRQRIVAVVPAVENSISGTSYRPGDVISSRSGQTIEVLNTDAEGRIVLADALDYAVTKYSPQAVIDCATLTGAVLHALGDHACAVLGNDSEVVERLRAAGEKSGERAWQLPLWDGHRRDVDSQVADVRNTGAQAGGTIAAAAFLERFVSGVPWAHLDIAGVARDRRDAKVGSTGFGVRILAEALAAWPVKRGSRAGAGGKAKRKPATKAKRKTATKTRRKR